MNHKKPGLFFVQRKAKDISDLPKRSLKRQAAHQLQENVLFGGIYPRVAHCCTYIERLCIFLRVVDPRSVRGGVLFCFTSLLWETRPIIIGGKIMGRGLQAGNFPTFPQNNPFASHMHLDGAQESRRRRCALCARTVVGLDFRSLSVHLFEAFLSFCPPPPPSPACT